jgi:meiotic recombination protein SPO11
VQGKGYPDLCTRELCARLWRELQLPVLALTDADPHGLHIAAVYKFGSNVWLPVLTQAWF